MCMKVCSVGSFLRVPLLSTQLGQLESSSLGKSLSIGCHCTLGWVLSPLGVWGMRCGSGGSFCHVTHQLPALLPCPMRGNSLFAGVGLWSTNEDVTTLHSELAQRNCSREVRPLHVQGKVFLRPRDFPWGCIPHPGHPESQKRGFNPMWLP